jgi:hypothetical protein
MIVSQRHASVGTESFAVAYERRLARGLNPGRLARLAARLRGPSLDAALIGGADPARSRLLAARAASLSSREGRVTIAEGIERLVRMAQGPQRRWWALSSRNTVLANSSELHALAALLRSERPLYARGVAILRQLLTDSSSVAYGDEAEGLARRLVSARAALLE